VKSHVAIEFLSHICITDVCNVAVPFVYLFICPSVTLRYRVKTAKHIVEILSPPESSIILVF